MINNYQKLFVINSAKISQKVKKNFETKEQEVNMSKAYEVRVSNRKKKQMVRRGS